MLSEYSMENKEDIAPSWSSKPLSMRSQSSHPQMNFIYISKDLTKTKMDYSNTLNFARQFYHSHKNT